VSSTKRGANRDGLDRYYTDPTIAAALVDLLWIRPGATVVEPSVGRGAFIQAARARLCRVVGVDVDPEAAGLQLCEPSARVVGDLLATDIAADWYLGNPPYKHAEQHIRHGLQRARVGCAFLLRLAFLESQRRYPFWQAHPPARVWVLSRRPSFTGGKTDSCAYAWIEWRTGYRGAAALRVLAPDFEVTL
jgi:hypothetical protein